MDIKDSYLHGTVGVVKSISVDADTLKYTLADKGGTVTNVVLPTATQSANGLLSKEDKIKLDSVTGPTLSIPYIVGSDTDTAGNWTGSYPGITTYTDGLSIIYVPKVAGISGGTKLKINNLAARDCYYNATSKLTTHFPAGTPILFTYSNGGWRRADYNTDTCPSAISYSKGDVASKTATCSSYTLTTNSYLHISMVYANTLAGQLTLNVNGKGAKRIFINGVVSSSTNYNLPAGTYIVFHDGTNFHFRTDGILPGNIEGAKHISNYVEIPSNASNLNGYYKFATIDVTSANWDPASTMFLVQGIENTTPCGILSLAFRRGGNESSYIGQLLWLTLNANNYKDSIFLCKALDSNNNVINSVYNLYFKPKETYRAIKIIALTSYYSKVKTIKGGWVDSLPENTLVLTSELSGYVKSSDTATSADKVKNNLTLKINSGTTEGTSLYTYNGSAAKTLDIKNGTGIGFTNSAGSLQISNAGVRSIATGTANGTISVNTNGTAANIAVKGLGSAAYTSSDLYLKQTSIVNTNTETIAYKKVVISKNATDGYGIWIHSRYLHYLLNSGLTGGSTIGNNLWELGTNFNNDTPGTARHMHIKMIATSSSSTVTLYAAVEGYCYMQIVSSGTIVINDSTELEYNSITSLTAGWVACLSAKWTDTTYGVVSSSVNGLAPKVINTNTVTVGSAYYVLASTNGSASPSWYKLPANAFKNDDTKVTQTDTTASANYRVLLSGNDNDTTETTTARKSTKLLFNPGTGELKSKYILTEGIHSSVASNLETLSESGNNLIYNKFHKNIFTNETGITVTGNANGVLWVGTHAPEASNTTKTGYGHMLAFTGGTGGLYHKVVVNGDLSQSWKLIAYITSDITGNAATADKLKTKRKLWGLDFDGSADVSGDMTGVGNITINAIDNKDYFINFLSNSTPSYSWRLGYLGSGFGNANYFVIDSSKASGGTWHRALQIGNETLDATFTGTVTAPTFKGELSWSYITDKPTSYTPAAHTHNLLTWSGDVRNTATTPSDYKKAFRFVGIKAPDAIGLNKEIAGSHVSLIGWKGYSDNSGPKSWELASDNNNRIHVRSGRGVLNDGSGNENWSNWNTLAYTTDNFPSNQINALTDYTKATEASSIVATDSLNTALGKLEYKADVACDWITSVTAEDTDKLVNKWGEIVDFLDSVAEGTDILDEFVTRKTDLTITGLKTFESNSSTTGVSLILKNEGWAANMSTAMDFYNGGLYKVPNARIETRMVGSGKAGGTLIFYTLTKHESTNPNPNGLTERFRIGDDGTSKITGAFTVTGDVTATKFITSGGTSAKFVKGDGSLDSNKYLINTHDTNTSAYFRTVTVNGTVYGFWSHTDTPGYTIYGPTSAGTKNLVLISNGSSAPTWINPTSLTVGVAQHLLHTGGNTGSNKSQGLWFLVGELIRTDKTSQINSNTLFYVTDYYLRHTFGLIRIEVRVESNKTAPNTFNTRVLWMLNNGFDPANLLLSYKQENRTINNVETEVTVLKIYVKADDNNYSAVKLVKISDGGWNNESTDQWTLVSNRLTALPNDETYIVSEIAPIYNQLSNTLTFSAGAFSTKTYNNSAAVTVNIPTHTSHLTNNSGFLTQHQSLANYVTIDGTLTISGLKKFSNNILFSLIGGSSSTDTTVTYPVESKYIGWSGASDWARIFYRLTAYNKGHQVFQLGDDSDSGSTWIFEYPAKVAITVSGAGINPGTDNELTLGTSALKWKNVYATTFTGDLSGNAATVTCAASTSDYDRPIVVTNKSNGLYYTTKATINYSTGNITAPTFTGNLNGVANVANKLSVNAGSSTEPVCFVNGVPVACNSLNIRRTYIIDLETSITEEDGTIFTFDRNKFYPVLFDSSIIETDCEITSPLLGGNADYNQNAIHFLLKSMGWSDTPYSFKILSYGVYQIAEITIGAVGIGTKAGYLCVWLRGGIKYTFHSNKKPTLQHNGFTLGITATEVYTVGTNYYGGENSNVNIIWQALDGSNEVAVRSQIPTKVSQLTNDSGFLTSRGYIGTTAVQASSAALALNGITSVTSTGALQLKSTDGNIYLRLNNDDTKSVCLTSELFSPTTNSSTKISLGSTNNVWNGIYSTTGRFTGDLTLYTASGDSPALVFHRGTIGTDTVVDWRIYVTAGHLKIQNALSSYNSGAWSDVLQFDADLTNKTLNSSYHIVPVTNNTLALGTSSLRWSNVYSVSGNFTGNVTSTGFIKSNSSDSYVLLGGGGHKALSDFLLETEFESKELSSNLITITKSLKLTKEWLDTGIILDATTFKHGNGTYAVQVLIHAGSTEGFYDSYFSGIMSVYTGSTNSSNPDDEIILHHNAHACNHYIYLKTIPTAGGSGHYSKIQISCNKNFAGARDILFKFKKLI